MPVSIQLLHGGYYTCWDCFFRLHIMSPFVLLSTRCHYRLHYFNIIHLFSKVTISVHYNIIHILIQTSTVGLCNNMDAISIFVNLWSRFVFKVSLVKTSAVYEIIWMRFVFFVNLWSMFVLKFY